MWRKKLLKLIPSYLHFVFDEENIGEVDQPRNFDFKTTGFHTIKSVESIEREEHNSYYMKCWEKLSFREQEIVALVCMGQTNPKIADALGIAEGTVKKHLDNLFGKFKIHDRNRISSALNDWDLRTWWEVRHISPTPLPEVRI